MFTIPREKQAAPGDVIEVAADTDTNSYRLRVGQVSTDAGFPFVTGRVIDLHGRPIGLRSLLLDGSVAYVVTPPRGLLSQLITGRTGRYRA